MTLLLNFAESVPAGAPDAHVLTAGPMAPAPDAQAPAPPSSSPALFPLRVELVKWKQRNNGTLAGYVDVTLPAIGMTLHGIRVKTDSASSPYALIPGRPDAADPAVWKSIISFETYELGEAFSDAVIAALLAVHPDAFSPSPASQHEGLN